MSAKMNLRWAALQAKRKTDAKAAAEAERDRRWQMPIEYDVASDQVVYVDGKPIRDDDPRKQLRGRYAKGYFDRRPDRLWVA